MWESCRGLGVVARVVLVGCLQAGAAGGCKDSSGQPGEGVPIVPEPKDEIISGADGGVEDGGGWSLPTDLAMPNAPASSRAPTAAIRSLPRFIVPCARTTPRSKPARRSWLRPIATSSATCSAVAATKPRAQNREMIGVQSNLNADCRSELENMVVALH